ncbi:MAG: hypothetical protein M3Y43_11145 [Pseudomonadota bacterium]|nr:hypothetical protein [Pseudomonadota bacterium]MDQ2705715.1 hypothetical protein [Pseudomonadota bacterium]
MNTIPQNHRETGARKLQSAPLETDRDREGIEAAENKPPADGQGLSQNIDETNEKTRQSEGTGQPPAISSSGTRKSAGAGPALAEHSKDAKAPRDGRQSGTYVKD